MEPKSLIINEGEVWSLSEMVDFKKGTLLYRATRDGFSAAAFHNKCDGKANTVTVIKTDSNYVFGVFASAAWNSSGGYITDRNAFVFSLRKEGISRSEKFMIKRGHFDKALIGNRNYGPIFGGKNVESIYHSSSELNTDIFIINNSNVNRGSGSNIGGSYQLPTYLAGSKNDWLTTEIEVYELISNEKINFLIL